MSCYFDSYFLSGKQAAVLGTEPGQRPGGQSRNLPITDQSLRQEMGTFQGGRLPYPHLPTHCPCSERRGCADPWLCWSQRVLSSNPPKSLPGIGISPELVYNLAASCSILHCGWTHVPSLRHRPEFPLVSPSSLQCQSRRKCPGQEAVL